MASCFFLSSSSSASRCDRRPAAVPGEGGGSAMVRLACVVFFWRDRRCLEKSQRDIVLNCVLATHHQSCTSCAEDTPACTAQQGRNCTTAYVPNRRQLDASATHSCIVEKEEPAPCAGLPHNKMCRLCGERRPHPPISTPRLIRYLCTT